MIELLGVFALAYAFSVALIPVIRKSAVHRRLLDIPDGDRRSHKQPVPRLGGVAVFGGFFLAAMIGVIYNWKTGSGDPGSIAHTVQLMIACAILFGIGLADDLRGVTPMAKLAGQTLAALIVQYNWDLLPAVSFANVTIELGWLGVPIMVIWLVGISNALNLVDGLDGLAAGVSLIALAALVVSTPWLGTGALPLAAVALAGAMLGFLRYNFPPATIFLGDSGSLVVGFLLAFFSVRRATHVNGPVVALVPIFALAYPLLDTGMAILRRWLRGDPLSRADGRHIHHQLQSLGLSDRKALAVIYTFSVGVAALGLSVSFAPPAFTVAVMAVGALLLIGMFSYGVRWLQYHEFTDTGILIGSAGTLAKQAIRDAINARDVANVIAKATSLQQIDAILGSKARTFGFAHMEAGPCDARLPHAATHSAESLWKLEYPIAVHPPQGSSNVIWDDSFVLAIWCAKTSSTKSSSAERVARVLADAIADWSAHASEEIGKEIRRRARTSDPSYADLVAKRRVSGEIRRPSGKHRQISLS